jgi:Protein of unknown function (DUF4058)
MPLLDHFHAPLAPRRHWESFHVNWAGAMADLLNEQLLPEGYFAEEHAHAGARVEIDVATFSDRAVGGSPPGPGDLATIASRVWAPPTPKIVLPAAFPDTFAVLVFAAEGGTTLVSAIELVSPANKDRSTHRRAFAIKCASYLCQGISLVVIDIVTSRQANVHNEMVALLGHGAEALLPSDVSLYAVAYRPLVGPSGEQIHVWPAPMSVGHTLPALPLALNAEVCLELDLESTYTTACQRRRLE